MMRAALFALVLLPVQAVALELQVPANARLLTEERTAPDSYNIPIGAYSGGALPTRTLEGRVTRRSWRIPAPGVTTLQLIAPLRGQLEADDFETVFECDTDQCGGFDFRFATEILRAPHMHVDLTDFRFLAARGGSDDDPFWVSLLVSRTGAAGFLQVIEVVPASTEAGTPVRQVLPTPQPEDTSDWTTDLPKKLETAGRIVLSDLDFPSGSSDLAEGSYDSLTALAAYLKADTGRNVALVGHTDTEGSLATNIALSKRRAASVVARLVARHGVSARQITAEGMGYLAPLTTNLTEDGRSANRRVEAILLSVD